MLSLPYGHVKELAQEIKSSQKFAPETGAPSQRRSLTTSEMRSDYWGTSDGVVKITDHPEVHHVKRPKKLKSFALLGKYQLSSNLALIRMQFDMPLRPYAVH